MGKGGEDYGVWKIISETKTSEDREIFPTWAKSVDECEKHYGVRKRVSLKSAEVDNGVAVISFVLPWYDGEEGREKEIKAFVEPLVIFIILILSAIVGVWQENNAEKALEDLKEVQSEHAMVIRDGSKVSKLPAKEIVQGDIVELKVGDRVLADMQVAELMSSL